MSISRIATASLAFLLATLPVPAQEAGKDQVRVSKTERVDFAPGGTIHITGSHGDLNVEGWDRPEVEVTVMKSTLGLYSSTDADAARQRLDRIAVTLDRKAASELTISTAFPGRTLKRLNRGKSDIILEYRIHVPQNSNVVVHHDDGAVLLNNISGDLEASAHAGDILLVLPGKDGYSIDARTKLGGVESDFGGTSTKHNLTGRVLAFQPPSAAHRIHLRLWVGNINIKRLLARTP